MSTIPVGADFGHQTVARDRGGSWWRGLQRGALLSLLVPAVGCCVAGCQSGGSTSTETSSTSTVHSTSVEPTVTVSGTMAETPTPTSTPQVAITSPQNGARVEQIVFVRGKSQAIPRQSVIWVVVRIPQLDRYYPQDVKAVVNADGSWTSKTYLGVEGDKGKPFEILAVVAGQEAQSAFSAYLEKSRKTQDYAGMETLPAGAEVHSQARVVRK